MKFKNKKFIVLAVFIFIFVIYIFIGGMSFIKNKYSSINASEPIDGFEEYIDELVPMLVRGKPHLTKKPLLGSEDVAKQYALMLYTENFGVWDESLEIWVKHYKEYGVWYATLRAPEPRITGPPSIIFQDEDGKIIWYSN